MESLKFRKYFPFLLVIAGLLVGCKKSATTEKLDNEQYKKEIHQWQKKRVNSISGQDGWLSLAGLYWLEQGKNSFGGHKSNDIVFPSDRVPDHIGSFTLQDTTIRMHVNKEVDIHHDGGSVVNTMVLKSDTYDNPTTLSYKSLSWYIIRRDEDNFAVRLRDSKNPKHQNFKGIERYPIDPSWRIKASFKPYESPKTISVPTIYGTTRKRTATGALVFNINGKRYRLDPIDYKDGSPLFVIFADKTNRDSTYEGGRYLYVNRPGPDNTTIIDFNKAYNPPCAYTEFATCPLPPSQNRLPIAINAGEKRYQNSDH